MTFRRLSERCRSLNPQLRLFIAGMSLLGAAGGILETTFNNFLHDRFQLGADARGILEFPRELPGFLTALFAGLLFFLPETLIASACALVIGAGMFGLAVWGDRWAPMVAFMVLWSIGAHLIMPIGSSIGMELAHADQKGRRLGQVGAVGTVATLVGCGAVVLLLRTWRLGYGAVFGVGGAAALAAVFFFAAMRLPGAHLSRPKFIWRRRYWLFYVLAFLFGARKQIFLTFGPWVLIKGFDQPAYIFAQLWIAAAVLGILFQPCLGRIIDRFGERAVLTVDSLLVAGVCAGYGLADSLPSRPAALGLLYACYVGDQLLFAVNMARSTYLSKIALSPEHVGPSLSLGITINHAVSMSVPALGGLIWVRWGHGAVFAVATGIAVLMLLFSAMVRVPARSGGVGTVTLERANNHREHKEHEEAE